MMPSEKSITYPIFALKQVLSSSHLNQAIDYLDEQERLTRANLIGIGIVCGLEIRFNPDKTPATIQLSKGCGITSEGYLIVEPYDLELVSYRPYTLPPNPNYENFNYTEEQEEPPVQYQLWELFPEGEPDTKPLASEPKFLSDKALLLFYELNEERLRTCSPNECDDKGSAMTATVRRLLIQQDDLNKIIAVANKLPTGSTAPDLEQKLLAPRKLGDLRLRRYDVPNTSPITTNDVLGAFLDVFKTKDLAHETGKALSAAHRAFYPLLGKTYPNDPFEPFRTKFGFLDKSPTETEQVRFLQYYYDFFDDLLKAYEEFRRHGLDLLCSCLPLQGLFPRHLMLGDLVPGTPAEPSIHRHSFLASPAMAGGKCAEQLKQLFQRLVVMIDRFNMNPPLPKQSGASKFDEQIRLTPSTLGPGALSEKAIPYYYDNQNGPPFLYTVWNYEKSRQFRANQNLSYRSYEYVPAAPEFVTKALEYDLEPYNFLRIEGHLGKDFKSVLNMLLYYKAAYRLPIDIIALRTGNYKETVPSKKGGLTEIEQKDLLNFFLKSNPGIQHKAGVPLGGTFIIVYHAKSESKEFRYVEERDEKMEKILKETGGSASSIDPKEISMAINRLSFNPAFKDNTDVHLLVDAVVSKVPDIRVPPFAMVKQPDNIIKKTVDNLEDGTVIADYYLPYPCGSEKFEYTACTLPCEGIALRRGYRFSLPQKGAEIKECSFWFEGPRNERIYISGKVDKLIHKFGGGEDFGKQISAFIDEEIKKLVETEIGSQDYLILKYVTPKPVSGVELDTWEIEYFKCLEFEFIIQWTQMEGKHPTTRIELNQNDSRITMKTEEGSVKVKIPAFNIKSIDKCDPKRPETYLCKEVKLTLDLKKVEVNISENYEVSATLAGTLQDEYTAFLWEVQDGIPALSNEKQVNFTFKRKEYPKKIIQLSAYTKDNCRAIAQGMVDLKTREFIPLRTKRDRPIK